MEAATRGLYRPRPGLDQAGISRRRSASLRQLANGYSPQLLRAPFSMLYRVLFRRCRNHYGIELPYSVKLGRRVIIEHQGGIVIRGDAVIGDDCIIRQGVTLGNKAMNRPFEAPRLGKRVNAGAGAKILGAVSIVDGVDIEANAVVLQNVPERALVVGIPGRIIETDLLRDDQCPAA